ncbi:hypothetical protein D3C78_629990 [compost metagenome]
MQGKNTKQNILGHNVSHRAIYQPYQRHVSRQTSQIELINSSPGSVEESKITKLLRNVGKRHPSQDVVHLCRVTDIRPLAEL